MKILTVIVLGILLLANTLPAQDKAEYQKKFIWDSEQTILIADFSKIVKPTIQDFKNQVFHFDPVRQDTTGTCWSYCTTSFLESEIFRTQQKHIKLSEMYTVYWEYIEKARRFLREKGNSVFEEGSQSNFAIERIMQYGCVPLEVYTGLINGQTRHNHEPMHKEMKEYLQFLVRNDYINEEVALTAIRAILNKYMGEPPSTFEFEGTTYTPARFRDEVCHITGNDYIDFMSTIKYPFYTRAEYDVPDNWAHNADYHNVPLDQYFSLIKKAIQNGYSIAIGGDVSEPGKYGWGDIAVIVPWDLPQSSINQYSRELRIYNKTSEDDHGIHLVGITRKDGHDWFLIKDSGSSAYYGEYKGYYFFRDDFVKLKMLSFMVHKDAVADILKKFENAE